jgi:glycosyltransferase involved in cell wall biosynthesis
MKICLVTSFPPSRDALNEYGFHIASELRQLPGISLCVLADEYSPVQPELEGFSVARCWQFNSLSNPWRVLSAIRRERPDVVWFNLGFASFGGKALPAFLGIAIPCFARLTGSYTHVTLHQLMETVDLEDAGVRFPLAYKIGGFIATQIVLFANSVSVMLPAYRNVLVEKYKRGAVYVRRHGIFSSRPEYPDFSKRGNPEHRILAFGKWGTYKRLELLLEAFDEVVERCPEARLVVAGTDHPKTPGYLKGLQEQYSHRKEISFIGYVAEQEIGELLQRSTVAVLPYTSSAGSSGIAHLACTYGVPILASDIPDFRRLADEEDLAIDFFPPGDSRALGEHLEALLSNRERQVEMALQNVSAALRMSMPEIIREYLRTFELRQGIGAMRSMSRLRKLPRWFPFREKLLRRKAIQMTNGASVQTPPDHSRPVQHEMDGAEVVYMANAGSVDAHRSKTGTDL